VKLYRTTDGPVLELDGAFYKLTDDWDALVNHETLARHEGRRAPIRSREARKLPHIRHSFATETLRGGCDICRLQHVMGHKDIRTTMIYLHFVEQTVTTCKAHSTDRTRTTNRPPTRSPAVHSHYSALGSRRQAVAQINRL